MKVNDIENLIRVFLRARLYDSITAVKGRGSAYQLTLEAEDACVLTLDDIDMLTQNVINILMKEPPNGNTTA